MEKLTNDFSKENLETIDLSPIKEELDKLEASMDIFDTPEDVLKAILDEMDGNREISVAGKLQVQGTTSFLNNITINQLGGKITEFYVSYKCTKPAKMVNYCLIYDGETFKYKDMRTLKNIRESDRKKGPKAVDEKTAKKFLTDIYLRIQAMKAMNEE